MKVRARAFVVTCAAIALLIPVAIYIKTQFDSAEPKLSLTAAQAFKNTARVEVPEVYELMHIALAVSELAGSKEDTQFIRKDTSYYQEVIAHFDSYSKHPFIVELEHSLRKARAKEDIVPFAILRYQALTYGLNEGGELVPNQTYVLPWLVAQFAELVPIIPFNLNKHTMLMSDFSKTTNFKQFYRDHQPYYDSLISLSYDLCDYRRMWNWLEAQFPNKYESYRIVYSPLTGGFHSTMNLQSEDGDIKQTLMFVSAPILSANVEAISVAEQANKCRIVFTEIDHNYVNPLTSTYIAKLRDAMPDYRRWNTGKQGYASEYETFNEYITWGVFSLYALDTFPKSELESILEQQENFMVKFRGFPKFKEFNRELLKRYRERQEDKMVADLYPEMLAWVSEQNSAAH